MKRILDCQSSDFRAMDRASLLAAIAGSEGRTIACETIGAIMPMLGDITNAEFVAAMGADILLLNMFDVQKPHIAALPKTEPENVIHKLRELTGRPIGINLEQLGADFIAMPGHKGLLGPQGTGLLLCGRLPEPLLYGGTGTASKERDMPWELPERLEAGTLNVPGIAGLDKGLSFLQQVGISNILRREQTQAKRCAQGLRDLGRKLEAAV